MFGIWALLSAGWIAGINLAVAILTHPPPNWSELMGRARYWVVVLALPIGLAVTLREHGLKKGRWQLGNFRHEKRCENSRPLLKATHADGS